MVFLSCCVVMVVSMRPRYHEDNGDADAMVFVQLDGSFTVIRYLGG